MKKKEILVFGKQSRLLILELEISLKIRVRTFTKLNNIKDCKKNRYFKSENNVSLFKNLFFEKNVELFSLFFAHLKLKVRQLGRV